MSVLVCPRCNSNSHMRKVSAVVSEGTAASGYKVSSTDLASKLKMSPMPRTTMTGSDVAGPLGIGCLVSWITWLLIALIGYKVLQFGKSGEPYAIGLLITVMLVSIIVSTNFSKRRQEEARRVREETIQWNRMQQIWDELYYCSRNDIVFSESNPSEFASASLMVGWLAQQAG